MTVEEINELSDAVIGAAISVHEGLGPGLMESAYEACLAYELDLRGLNVSRRVEIPVRYKEVELPCGYRADMVVENSLLLELKSVEALRPVHQAQVATYLKLARLEIGILMNFNETHMKNGIFRLANSMEYRSVENLIYS